MHGKTQEEHDTGLRAVLKRIESARGTLNKDNKWEFSKELLTFLGQVVGKQGVSSDPEKTRAIVEMEAPKNLKELRRFMGMINQLGKFSPNLVECTQPLRELLSPRKAVMGTSTGGGIQEGEGVNKIYSARLVWFKRKDEDPSWCLHIQTRCRLIAKSRGRGVETNRIHLQVHDQDRKVLLTDRERGPCSCSCLGVWEVCWLCHQQAHPNRKTTNPWYLYWVQRNWTGCHWEYWDFDYASQDLTIPSLMLMSPGCISTPPIHFHVLPSSQWKAYMRMTRTLRDSLNHSWNSYQQAKREWNSFEKCRKTILFAQRSSGTLRMGGQRDMQSREFWRNTGERKTSFQQLTIYYCTVQESYQSHQYEILMKIHHGHQGIQRCRLRVSSSVWWPRVSKQV